MSDVQRPKNACLSGGAHEFLGNTSVSDARCKKCTFEYDGWVVGVNRDGKPPTHDHERIQQIEAEIQTLQEANRIDRAKLALLEALGATDD